MLYECPKCKAFSESKEWDTETIKYFDIENEEYFISIEKNISGSWYCCPSCFEEISMDNIETNLPIIKSKTCMHMKKLGEIEDWEIISDEQIEQIKRIFCGALCNGSCRPEVIGK